MNHNVLSSVSCALTHLDVFFQLPSHLRKIGRNNHNNISFPSLLFYNVHITKKYSHNNTGTHITNLAMSRPQTISVMPTTHPRATNGANHSGKYTFCSQNCLRDFRKIKRTGNTCKINTIVHTRKEKLFRKTCKR